MSDSINSLIFDCSDQTLSVALKASGIVSSETLSQQHQHAQLLLPVIDKLLNQSSIQLKQIDIIGYTNGPGSFTGLRIAVGCAQGLGYGIDCPLMPISSLYALALSAGLTITEPATILTLLDAKMGEVYYAQFTLNSDQTLQQDVKDSLLSTKDFKHIVQQELPIYAVGSGVHLVTLPNSIHICKDVHIHAEYLIPTLEANYQKQLYISPIQAEPTYLRQASAWRKMNQQ